MEQEYAIFCQTLGPNFDNFPFTIRDGKLISIDDAKLRSYITDLKKEENQKNWATRVFRSESGKGYDAAKVNRFLIGLTAMADHRELWAKCGGSDSSAFYKQYTHRNIGLFCCCAD